MRLSILADAHLSDSPSETYQLDTQANLSRCIARLRDLDPDFLVLLGDYSFDEPKRSDVEWLAARIALAETPYAAVVGNHDRSEDVAEVLMQSQLMVGDRLYYRRDFEGLSCLFLDTRPGNLDSQQVQWLRHELESSKAQTLVFMHHPPVKAGVHFMDERHAFSDEGGHVFEALFGGRKPVTVFAGHYHSARSLHIGVHTLHLCPSTAYQINPLTPGFEVTHSMPALRHVELVDGQVRTWVDVLARK